MTHTYFLSTDAETASNIRVSIPLIEADNGSAWLISWADGFASLQARIRSLLPRGHARVVVAEITDYVAI